MRRIRNRYPPGVWDFLCRKSGPVRRELLLLVEVGDDEDLLAALVRSGKLANKQGRQDAWHGHKPDVVEALDAAEAERIRLVHDHRSEVLGVLAERLRRFALDGAEDRRRRVVH